MSCVCVCVCVCARARETEAEVEGPLFVWEKGEGEGARGWEETGERE